MEDAIYDIKPFSTFMGVDLSGVPDATVLCNFRKIVNDNGLGGKIFALVKAKMDRNGSCSQR